MMRFLVMLLILVLTACSKEPEKTANTKNEPVMVQSPTPQEPEQPRLNFVNLKEAIVAIKPTMSDTVNEISQGAALLALWSLLRFKWKRLTVINFIMAD
jgi:PBP1b-binding outer membrane lipoprotein LpoB